MYNLCPHCQNPIDLAVWALKERDRAEGEATTAKTHEEIAKDNEEKAKTNEAEAKKNAAETRRILGEFSVANGLRELKEGNFGLVQPPAVSGGAVLWVRMPILTELVRISILTHRPAPPCVEPGRNFFPALLWFAEPLVRDPDNADSVELTRCRLTLHWRYANWSTLTQVFFHRDAVNHAEFSPDGRRILTASLDKTARVWDAPMGQPVTPPLLHQHMVWHAAFSPDGRRVVTASGDKTARVWDAATGQPVSPPLPHQEWVNHAAFSSDGRRLVTASQDKTAQVWDVAPQERSPEDWLALVRLLAGHRLDATGSPQPLSAEEQQKLWTGLKARYPADFSVPLEQALAWHRQEAAACLREKNAAAALFHTLHGDLRWALLTGWPRR